MTDTTKARGLSFTVYRAPDGDFTADGISSTADRLTLVGWVDDDRRFAHGEAYPVARHSQVFASSEEAPPVVLHIRRIFGDTVASLVPATVKPDGRIIPEQRWTMAGGNYAVSSDSRVSDLLSDRLGHGFYGALSIHDRIED